MEEFTNVNLATFTHFLLRNFRVQHISHTINTCRLLLIDSGKEVEFVDCEGILKCNGICFDLNNNFTEIEIVKYFYYIIDIVLEHK